MAVLIDHGLGVVAVVEGPIRGLHDPRLRVSERPLRLRRDHRRGCRFITRSGPLGLVRTLLRGGMLSLHTGLLRMFGFQIHLRLADRHQPALAPAQLRSKLAKVKAALEAGQDDPEAFASVEIIPGAGFAWDDKAKVLRGSVKASELPESEADGQTLGELGQVIEKARRRALPGPKRA